MPKIFEYIIRKRLHAHVQMTIELDEEGNKKAANLSISEGYSEASIISLERDPFHLFIPPQFNTGPREWNLREPESARSDMEEEEVAPGTARTKEESLQKSIEASQEQEPGKSSLPPLQTQEKQPPVVDGEISSTEQGTGQQQEGEVLAQQQEVGEGETTALEQPIQPVSSTIVATGDDVIVDGEVVDTTTNNTLQNLPQPTIPEAETTITPGVPEIATTTTVSPSIQSTDPLSSDPLPTDPPPSTVLPPSSDPTPNDPTAATLTTSETAAATVVNDLDGLFSDSVSDVDEAQAAAATAGASVGEGSEEGDEAGGAGGGVVISQKSMTDGPLVGAPPLVPPSADNTTTDAVEPAQGQGLAQQTGQDVNPSETNEPVTTTSEEPQEENEENEGVSSTFLPLANDATAAGGGPVPPPQLPLSMQDQVALLLSQKPSPFLDLPPPDTYSNPPSPRTLEGTTITIDHNI